MSEIKKIMKQLTATDDEVYSIVGSVMSVDKSERTCNIQPIDGSSPIRKVRMQASMSGQKGIVFFPKKDSLVIVTFINESTGYIALCDEVDEVVIDMDNSHLSIVGDKVKIKSDSIELNGGSLGGLAKTLVLKSELDKVVQFITMFKQLISTPVPEPGLGAPSAFQAVLNALSAIPTPDFSQIENTKIKQ